MATTTNCTSQQFTEANYILIATITNCTSRQFTDQLHTDSNYHKLHITAIQKDQLHTDGNHHKLHITAIHRNLLTDSNHQKLHITAIHRNLLTDSNHHKLQLQTAKLQNCKYHPVKYTTSIMFYTKHILFFCRFPVRSVPLWNTH